MHKIIPLSLGKTAGEKAEMLRPLHKVAPEIVADLQARLAMPLAPTDAITALHQLQRLALLAELGLEDPALIHEVMTDRKSFPIWEDFASLPVPDEKKARVADLLFKGDVRNRSPAMVDLCDYSRDIGEHLIERCIAENIEIDVEITDPWLHFRLLNILDEAQLDKYVEIRKRRNSYADRSMECLVNTISIPVRDPKDPAKSKKHADLVVNQRRRSGELFYTLTMLPTPEDAKIDQMDYRHYLEKFFGMCDVDYTKIAKAHDVLLEKLDKGSHLRFTNNDGTDIEMDIGGFTFASSLVAKNIPGSEVFSAPHRDSVNGRIVAKGRFMRTMGELMENITLIIKDGVIVEHKAEIGQAYLDAIIATDEGSNRIGEIGIGTNPVLQEHMINSLMVEKIGCSFHVAIGQAYKFTDYLGKPVHMYNGNDSKIHWDITTMLVGKQGRMELDGEKLMENGRYIVPGLEILNGPA